MQKSHIRSVFILAALIFTALMGVGCGPTTEESTPTLAPITEEAPTEEAQSYDLTVLEWAYYEVPDMWADYAKAHPDANVEFTFGSSDDDIFAQVQAGSEADIFHFYTPFLKFYVDEGLIQPLDVSRLEHWDQIPSRFQEMCMVDGKVYCVPWDWGFTSILYRTDKVTRPIDSWRALLDEEYAGHISMWDSGHGAAEVGSYMLGYDEANLTGEQLEEIKQLWIDQKDLNAFYWNDEPDLVEAMQSGDVWIAYAWNGAYYNLLSADVPVAFATPEEGRNSWVGQYAISAETDNYDAAIEFLDLKLAEQTAINLLTQYAYGHVNPVAYDAVTDENLIEALSLDDPTILGQTNFTAPLDFEDFQRFVAMWGEVMATP